LVHELIGNLTEWLQNTVKLLYSIRTSDLNPPASIEDPACIKALSA